jgi:hypothetical protein
MDWPDLKLILDKMAVETELITPNVKGQILIPCPLAPWLHSSGTDRNPSLSIKVGVVPSVFKCFSCGESGKLWSLVDSFASFIDNDDLKRLALAILNDDKPDMLSELSRATKGMTEWIIPYDDPVLTLTEEIMDYERFPFLASSSIAYDYVSKFREVASGTIDEYDIRYDPRSQRIVFPVRDRHGKLQGAVGRNIEGSVRYHNYFGIETSKCLGGLHCLHDFPGLIIAEGFFDILHPWKWAVEKEYDIICMFHADMSPTQAEVISGLDRKVVIIYDNDEAGDAGWTKAKRLLGGTYGVNRVIPPKGVDLGSMTYDQFQECIAIA